jgi:hypothetical protein
VRKRTAGADWRRVTKDGLKGASRSREDTGISVLKERGNEEWGERKEERVERERGVMGAFRCSRYNASVRLGEAADEEG